MKKYIILFVLIGFVLQAFAQVPATLSYQGLLTDAAGVPVSDGNHNILFNFYTTATGGTPDFTRGPITVNSFKGLFTLILGNGQGSNNTALPLTLGETQYYVGIEADGQAELSPRVSLTAVPYAFVANTVKAVDANTITSGTVPDARLSPHLQDLADGSLDGTKVGTGINASNVTTGTLPSSVIPTISTVPVGTIVAFAGSTIPAGWLLCDGNTISRTTNSALFSAIGVNWGGGDGSTTFHLPDLRGRFLRGRSGTSGNDPDSLSRTALYPGAGVSDKNKVGSYQDDAFQGHGHSWTTRIAADGSGGGAISSGAFNSNQNIHTYFGATAYSITATNGGTPRTSTESRPKNAYVNFIIKAQ